MLCNRALNADGDLTELQQRYKEPRDGDLQYDEDLFVWHRFERPDEKNRLGGGCIWLLVHKDAHSVLAPKGGVPCRNIYGSNERDGLFFLDWNKVLAIDPSLLIHEAPLQLKIEPTSNVDSSGSGGSVPSAGGVKRERDREMESKRNDAKRIRPVMSANGTSLQLSQPPPLERPRPTSGNKRALCIGNDIYAHIPVLDNARNDATAMNLRLSQLGFDSVLQYNIKTQDQFKGLIDKFIDSLRMNDTVIIFYAGHAKQTEDGNNALLPCGARSEDPAEITIQYIHALIDAKQTPLHALGFIVDGCRTHGREPLAALGNWRLPSIPNTFYCFACGPGQTASDGDDVSHQGLFTFHILSALDQPHRDIVQIMREICAGVCRASQNKQVPWHHESIIHPFPFQVFV